MKKVLFIAYFFPPCGGGGVQRSSKFVKYLPRFNWKPYVLTVQEKNMVKDFSLMKDIPPDAEVNETYSLEKIFIKSSEGNIPQSVSTDNTSKPNGRSVIDLVLRNLKAFINQYIFQPDSAVLWFPFAVFRGLKVIKEKNIDLIYATGNPWTDLLIGTVLKKVTKRPLIVDLRDPWSISDNRKALDPFFERMVLRISDSIIMNTRVLKDAYTEFYPEYASKMVTITNGFDREDFIGVKPRLFDEKKIRVLYAGSLRSPVTFFKALTELLTDAPDLKEKMDILLIGPETEHWNIPRGLENVVRILGYRPHEELLSYMISVDLLLIIEEPVESRRLTMPAKIYEYLAARKPILAVVPSYNPTFEMIRSTNSGSAVEFYDIFGIKRSLLFHINTPPVMEPKTGPLSHYEREYLTSSLVEIFNECRIKNERPH